MSDPLRQLLRSADAHHPPPAPQADLPRQVRRWRKAQRRARAAAVSAVAAMVLLALVTTPTWLREHRHHDGEVAVAPTPSPAAAPAPAPPSLPSPTQIAALDLEAKLHERVADRLLAAERLRRRMAAHPPAHDPTLAALRQQRDRAALLLVYEADRYRKRKQPDEAIASYRRAIELFPQTHWADVARQRLGNM